jgi:hypothetical protein
MEQTGGGGMNPVRGSLDYWKAKAREFERKAEKFESLYWSASRAVYAAEGTLIKAHSILTLTLMSPLEPEMAAEIGLDQRKEISAETAVELAEVLLNEARCFLAAVRGRNPEAQP